MNKKNKTINFINEKIGYLVSFFFLFICLIYVIIKKDSIYIQIWDNLDSNISNIKLISDFNIFFNDNALVPILGGIDRSFFYSKLNIYCWLYLLFPTYYAMVVGWFIKVLFSIFGMRMLCKRIIANETIKDKNIFIIIGLLYGIASTYPTVAFSFSTLPFLLALLIDIYKNNNYKKCLLLLFYPMFSDLFLFGVFICGYILIYFGIDWIRNRKPRVILLLAALSLTIGYLIVNIQLLNVLVFSNINTIRNDNIQTSLNYSFIYLLKTSLDVFINGIDYANVSQKYVILPVTTIYLVYLLSIAIKNKNKSILKNSIVFYLYLWIIFNCLVYGLDSYAPFKNTVSKIFSFLSEFSFARTIWINPFLWCLAFAILLTKINKKIIIYSLSFFCYFSIIFSVSRYNVVGANIRNTINIERIKGTELTYRDYYATELFEKIKKDIEYNNEWCVAYGFHPSIIQYNGFHTLDGYLSYYSKEYNVKFREIIEPQLLIDSEHKEYFDNWGARAYIFSMETSYNPWKEEYNNAKANINININKFKEMGGKYIISRVEIINANIANIKLIKTYHDDGYSYMIYLYECI